MVTGRGGVSIRVVLMTGLVVTAFGYLGMRIWTGQGGVLPTPTWGALIVLVFMAAGVFFAGLPVRRFLRGKATKPLNPIRAMRTLVLAQAAALTGAMVSGWYLAQALVLLPDFDIRSRRILVLRLVLLAAGGVLMAISGLVAQAMCRLDKPDPEGRDPEGNREDAGDRGGDGSSADGHSAG